MIGSAVCTHFSSNIHLKLTAKDTEPDQLIPEMSNQSLLSQLIAAKKKSTSETTSSINNLRIDDDGAPEDALNVGHSLALS